MRFVLTWKSHVMCMLISILAVIILFPLVNIILSSFFSSSLILYPTNSYILNFFIFCMLVMIPISCFHEAMHGIAQIFYGGKVKYGFKGVYAYTAEISGRPLYRNQFILVLLFPLLIISGLSLFLPGYLGGMIFLLNLLGASGDIYMSIFLMRFSAEKRIIDRNYGFEII